MSKPSIAVVGFVSSTPNFFEIVDLKVVDDSRRPGDGRMFARDADTVNPCPPWVEFQIVLGVFDTYEQAAAAREKSRADYKAAGAEVEKTNGELMRATRAYEAAILAHNEAKTEQRRASRQAFLGTPTDYR
ncbi:hypothetical protein D869_gp141 [Caulobacter phage CcrRogue]|uniref:Uncharacterized protein n=1 Tax=Caulobacter phage CcrRogue TaxID=2927986 RepID=K4JSP4_9CAUD|nr:hypothetical protein D869_gp141 [Caulobacter phage CcrRogue]AFU86773.1 hypothetical protein CcrRogue_gp291 [Caulobacter phage CcrRogue]